MKNAAVYAGTFDPITFGHVDLIERAQKIFDRTIIAIAISDSKQPLFSVTERIDLVKKVLKDQTKVEVHGFDTLLLDFAAEHQTNVILRGLRTVTDFDYELQLASMNRQLNPKIETLFLMPSERYMYVSSKLVREIASLHGDVSGFVPPIVAAALNQKMKAHKR